MKSSLSRRETLKLMSLLPLAMTKFPKSLPNSSSTQENNNLPNILILVFDALSAYNTSLHGYHRETTPHLSRFAQQTHVYHNHYASGNFTSSGTASLLTGTYPWTHRAINLHGTVDDRVVDHNIFNLFGDLGYTRTGYSHNLLVTSLFYQFRNDVDMFNWTRDLCLIDDQFADRVFPNDYNIAFWSEWLLLRGFKGNPASFFTSLLHRFYRYANKRRLTQELGDIFPRGVPNLHNLFFVLEDAMDWLMDQTVSLPQPYLMYFHVLPPHEPYTTRKDFVDLFNDNWKPNEKPASFFSEGVSQKLLNQNRREYDEYLAYADSEFGRVYDFLIHSGVLENTVVVVTSDHGEMFERGIRGHVTPTLYQPVVRVPLLISTPNQQNRVDVTSPTNHVDLLPTLLKLAGHKPADWIEGEILPPFNAGESTAEREIFSVEAKSNAKLAPLKKATISLVKGSHKLVYTFGQKEGAPSYELFDVERDPEEMNDLIKTSPGVFKDLQFKMQEKLESVNQDFG